MAENENDRSRAERFARFLVGADPGTMAASEKIRGTPEENTKQWKQLGETAVDLIRFVTATDPGTMAIGQKIRGTQEDRDRQWQAVGDAGRTGFDWLFAPPSAQITPPPDRVHPGVPMPGSLGAQTQVPQDALHLMNQILQQTGQPRPTGSQAHRESVSGPETQTRFEQYQDDTGMEPGEGIGYSLDPGQPGSVPYVRQEVTDGSPTVDKVLELLDALEMGGSTPAVQDPNTGWHLDNQQVRAIMEGDSDNRNVYIPEVPNHREHLLEHAYTQLLQQYNQANENIGAPQNILATSADIQNATWNTASAADRYEGATESSSYQREDDVTLPATYQNQENALAGQAVPAPGEHVLNLVSQMPRDMSQWTREDKDTVLNAALLNMDPALRAEITQVLDEDEIISDLLEAWQQLIAAGSEGQ